MGIKRVVDVGFWTDSKVVDLFSPEDKYFALYLLTNPHANLLGIYTLNPKIAAFEMGYSVEAIIVLLDRFDTKYEMLKYNRETQEVAIKNFLLYAIVGGGKPVLDSLTKCVEGVKDKSLLVYVYEQLQGKNIGNATVKEFVGGLSSEIETISKYGYECEYGYGYGYGSIVHDSSTTRSNTVVEPSSEVINSSDVKEVVTSKKRQKRTKKSESEPVKRVYGSYKNVRLSDEDLEQVKVEFAPNWEEWIERLSLYIASKGEKYKDHLATLRVWKRREEKERAEREAAMRQRQSGGRNYNNQKSLADIAASARAIMNQGGLKNGR